MATTPCMPASGPHHHTDSPCLSPHPFFVLWCGRRDARQLHVCVCVCAESPLCIQCVWCTHLCADLSGGTRLPPPSSSFHHHITWRRGRAAMHSSHAQQSRSGSEMIITNLAVCWHAMCCWMLMQSTRSTTLVQHVSHLYSSTAFPFPLSLTMRHTATPQRRR